MEVTGCAISLGRTPKVSSTSDLLMILNFKKIMYAVTKVVMIPMTKLS
jgi:hypothetical protein